MMDEKLKPCPFCPPDLSDPKIVRYYEDQFIVKCYTCGCMSGYPENTPERAAENWNTRAERTCRNFGKEEGTNGEMYDFSCSACGFCSCQTDANYCPNCGAKVVE